MTQLSKKQNAINLYEQINDKIGFRNALSAEFKIKAVSIKNNWLSASSHYNIPTRNLDRFIQIAQNWILLKQEVPVNQ